MSAHASPDQSPDSDARLARVEEALGFTERTVEQLSGEIADINKRLQSLAKRLAALEDRLGALEDPDTEPPP
jgi:uncharacterized coiled-coil protein SlyX